MFQELTDELLDLTSEELGFRGAVYARDGDDGGGGSSCCGSSSLTTCSLSCW